LAFYFLFEEINALKRHLNPEKTSTKKNRNKEKLHFKSSSGKHEGEKYHLIILNHIVLSRLIKQTYHTQQTITGVVVSLIFNHEKNIIRALADTDVRVISFLWYIFHPYSSKFMTFKKPS
jgi:macrodomain Ter protein organizer (MatP/YcbG family)